jgi:hypothetical protein
MNSQKGLDRIILLLAAIAIAPGIILGGSYAIRNFKELTPEYSEYIKNPSVWKVKEIAECRKEFDARKDTDNTVSINVGDGIYRIEGFTEFCGKYSNPPEKYKSKVATWKKKRECYYRRCPRLSNRIHRLKWIKIAIPLDSSWFQE